MAEIQINPWVPDKFRWAGYTEEGVEAITGEVTSSDHKHDRGVVYTLFSPKGEVLRELWNTSLTYFGSKDGAVQIIGYRPLTGGQYDVPTGDFRLETWFVDTPTKSR